MKQFTHILECYATSEDIQITISPLLLAIAEKVCHVCRLIESNIQANRRLRAHNRSSHRW